MPRILHTSDWHLGLELGGHSRLVEQERFLDWLLRTCQSRRIDALLVCGDIFDVLHPSVEAQSLLARFLVEFHRTLPQAQAILLAGNHDSPNRLEAPAPFADALGRIRLIGHWRPDRPDDHLVAISAADGASKAVCLAVPFLRSQDLQCRIEDGQSPEEARSLAIGKAYASLAEHARSRHPGLPLICTGHLTLAGSLKAGSERILIGGVESVPSASLVEEAAYTALGHIHRAQSFGNPRIRYSGSPLAMDFDESRHEHVVLQVDIPSQGAPLIEPIAVPVEVPLVRLGSERCDWDALREEVGRFDWESHRQAPRALQPLVELAFRESGPVVDLRERTESLLSDLPARLVGAPRIHRSDRTDEPADRRIPDLSRVDAPLSILEDHWNRRHGEGPPDDIVACFREAVEAVRAEAGA